MKPVAEVSSDGRSERSIFFVPSYRPGVIEQFGQGDWMLAGQKWSDWLLGYVWVPIDSPRTNQRPLRSDF